MSSARRCAARTCAPADEIVSALNERRILLAFEPVVETASRADRLPRMPDAHPPRRTAACWPASDVIPVAERLGLVRLLDHRVLELVVGELAAAPDFSASVNVSPASTIDPDWWSALRRAAARASRRRPSG